MTALFTLPRLTYPVPRAEPRDRPDASVALTSIHRLTQIEACKLIEYVLMEAFESIKFNESERFLDWDVSSLRYFSYEIDFIFQTLYNVIILTRSFNFSFFLS